MIIFNHLKIIFLLTLSLALNFDISAAEEEGPGENDMDTYCRACNFHCRFPEPEKATEIYDLLNTLDANTLDNPFFLKALETLITDAMDTDKILATITALAGVADDNPKKLENNDFITTLKRLFTEKVDTLTEIQIMATIAGLCIIEVDVIENPGFADELEELITPDATDQDIVRQIIDIESSELRTT